MTVDCEGDVVAYFLAGNFEVMIIEVGVAVQKLHTVALTHIGGESPSSLDL